MDEFDKVCITECEFYLKQFEYVVNNLTNPDEPPHNNYKKAFDIYERLIESARRKPLDNKLRKVINNLGTKLADLEKKLIDSLAEKQLSQFGEKPKEHHEKDLDDYDY